MPPQKKALSNEDDAEQMDHVEGVKELRWRKERRDIDQDLEIRLDNSQPLTRLNFMKYSLSSGKTPSSITSIERHLHFHDMDHQYYSLNSSTLASR